VTDRPIEGNRGLSPHLRIDNRRTRSVLVLKERKTWFVLVARRAGMAGRGDCRRHDGCLPGSSTHAGTRVHHPRQRHHLRPAWPVRKCLLLWNRKAEPLAAVSRPECRGGQTTLAPNLARRVLPDAEKAYGTGFDQHRRKAALGLHHCRSWFPESLPSSPEIRRHRLFLGSTVLLEEPLGNRPMRQKCGTAA
jgi:hypothetical protein